MTEQEQQQLEKIKSYGSISVLIFAGCISLMMFFNTKSKLDAEQNNAPSHDEVVMKERTDKEKSN